jgi:cell filamentation protein
MSAGDPYVYPGTDVLINKLDIRDADALRSFEIDIVAQRISEGSPRVALISDGFRELHHHLFQDVYDWAGQIRTVDIARPDAYFCRAIYISRQLDERFARIAAEAWPAAAEVFTDRAAEHIAELNAIHPFREGNGRTLRAFLEIYGEAAGHPVDIRLIEPAAWNAASRETFQTAELNAMKDVISRSFAPEQRPKRR